LELSRKKISFKHNENYFPGKDAHPSLQKFFYVKTQQTFQDKMIPEFMLIIPSKAFQLKKTLIKYFKLLL
jgi:hypothetical protein